ADEAGHAVAERHLDAIVLHRRHCAGDDVALLVLAGGGRERIVRQLLDAEADALLLDVDVEDLDLDDVALLEALDRLFAGLLPVEVGEVHHAVDLAGQPDEQAELRDVLDLALELGADRLLLDEALPGVIQALLQAEADAPLLRIDVEHHHLDLLAGRDDLAGMHVLLGPAHLGDVHQTLDAGLQLDESAVVGDVGDAALELRAGRIFQLDAFPRIGFELLHAERDALRLRVEPDHLY